MAFLLTHVEKTEEQKQADKDLLRGIDSSDLSSYEESFAEGMVSWLNICLALVMRICDLKYMTHK